MKFDTSEFPRRSQKLMRLHSELLFLKLSRILPKIPGESGNGQGTEPAKNCGLKQLSDILFGHKKVGPWVWLNTR